MRKMLAAAVLAAPMVLASQAQAADLKTVVYTGSGQGSSVTAFNSGLGKLVSASLQVDYSASYAFRWFEYQGDVPAVKAEGQFGYAGIGTYDFSGIYSPRLNDSGFATFGIGGTSRVDTTTDFASFLTPGALPLIPFNNLPSFTFVGGGSVPLENAPGGFGNSISYRVSYLYDASVAAVPEPATWAMMLLGFGMVAGASRYRRRSTAATYA